MNLDHVSTRQSRRLYPYGGSVPQQVTAFLVMTSGPGDVRDAMVEIRDSLTVWSTTYMKGRGAVLIPLYWKCDSVPQLGASGQEIINRQLLARADILFAAFRHKIGTATTEDISGTAEEIRKAHESGKPVHVYFDRTPMPDLGDSKAREQFDKVREFKRQLDGLYDEYEDIRELTAKVWRAIEADLGVLLVRAIEHDTSNLPAESTEMAAVPTNPEPIGPKRKAADLVVIPGSADPGFNHDWFKTPPHDWIVIINSGDADARDVVIKPVSDGAIWPEDGLAPMLIPAKQFQRVIVGNPWGFYGSSELEVTWTDDTGSHSLEFEY